jgi:hypothetical protein
MRFFAIPLSDFASDNNILHLELYGNLPYVKVKERCNGNHSEHGSA